MAQKKVILQDGQNDLMPKTLASVVFTKDGTSVETALKNLGSGGGSSGGGTGNVKVTNASGLVSSDYYAFKPSANGSLEGAFQIIPVATASKAGLMSSENYSKLYDMKGIAKLPNSVMEYTSSTPSSTIEAALQTALSTDTAQNTAIITAIMFAYISASLSGSYDSSFPKFYIGDRECMLGGNVVMDGSSVSQATLEFSYVDGGKLHTVAITMVVSGESGNETYTYSAKVLESGDDTYYLPETIYNLSSNSTSEEIKDILTKERNEEIKKAVKAGKKLYFVFATLDIFPKCIPVSYAGFSYTALSWIVVSDTENPIVKYVYSPNSSDQTSFVREFYLDGYSLNPELDSLTSSSDTDAISIAVGGESGLKAIIQAVKDGNRLVLKSTGENGTTSLAYIISAICSVSDNGDMTLALGYDIYAVIGFNRIGIAINYTKSSNTFTCNKTTV